jgi:hypothetical protein
MKYTNVTSCVIFWILIFGSFSCKSNLERLIKEQQRRVHYESTTTTFGRRNLSAFIISREKFRDFTELAEEGFLAQNRTDRKIVLPPGADESLRGITSNLNDTIFLICRPFLIENCEFKKEWWGEKSTTIFQHPVYFASCVFSTFDWSFKVNPYFIEHTKFDSIVVFENNRYLASLQFSRDTFYGQLIFRGQIDKSPSFVSSYFSAGISFGNESLWSDILGTKRNGFKDNLIFNLCTLKGKFDLSNCQFDSNATLIIKETFLPDTLDLSDTRLSKPIDLTQVYPNISSNKCQINLMGTDIELIKMKYGNFHLYFPDSIFYDPYSKDVISRTYEALLNNFKNNGFIDSYEQLDKEYKLWQSKYKWTLKLSYVWWQFGYEKWLILLWTPAILILFTSYNFNKYSELQSVYPIPKLAWSEIQYVPSPFLHWIKKYFATLLFTGFIFFRLSIDFKNINFKSMRYAGLIIFQYAVGLICTGFLLNWIIS